MSYYASFPRSPFLTPCQQRRRLVVLDVVIHPRMYCSNAAWLLTVGTKLEEEDGPYSGRCGSSSYRKRRPPARNIFSTRNDYTYSNNATSLQSSSSSSNNCSGIIQQHRHQQQQQRRWKGFSAPDFPALPAFVRDSVTTAIVNSATRDDSRLWTTTITTTPPTELQNNHNNNNNTTPHSSTSNSDISISENRTETLPSSLHQNYISINESTSSTTAATSANEETAVGDDLFLTDKTRYWPGLPPGVKTASDSSSSTGTVDPFAMARDELSRLAASIRQDLIGTDHFVLNQAASYFFDSAVVVDGGKKIRPMMVLLLSRALADSVSVSSATTITDGVTAAATTLTAPLSQPGINNHIPNNNGSLFTAPLTWQRPDLPAAQRRLAEISEMIHTASLFHDDVIDGSDTRRGAPAVHVVFGNKMAILAGDYLLARASICLARLRHVEVVETMSTIIEHLVRGEVMQLRGGGGGGSTSNHESSSNPLQQSQERINYYLRKNFYKTGSLMANSCKSTALLGNYPLELVEASYRFGKHVGMSFQLVDDVLDFEGTLSQLGKPALADLNAGLATAPVLFAAEEFPELEILIDRKFKEAGDVNKAVELVFESAGIERTKELARVHAEYAMNALLTLNQSDSRDALIHLANKVVARTK